MMCAAAMEATGELKWDIEPYNGRNCFFTRESYEKYSLGPTVTELLCNKPASVEPDPTPAKSESQDPQPPVTVSHPSVSQPPTKNLPPFPEPRVPYPRHSSLTASEQDTYVKLMIKFMNSTRNRVNVLQMKEYSHYEFLKLKLNSEHMEFQKFLQNTARSCAEDYDVLCPDATRYIQEMIKSSQVYVKNYPELYAVQDMTSILGGKFIPDLSLNLEKCLLKLGSVNFLKVKFPTDDILLPTSYNKVSHTMPPVTKAGRLHKKVTTDPNISKLVSKYCPQVVLTVQALYTLLNNHGPVYDEQWEIPIRVETINGMGDKPSKVVYMDSPLPKKVLSTREKSQIFHEIILDQFMLKNSQVAVKAVSLDKEEERLVNKEYVNRKPASDRKEVDFENDVTELETFGSINSDKSKAAKSDDKSQDFLLKQPTNSQLDKEKETINNTKQIKLGLDSKRIQQEKSSCQDSDMSETSNKSQMGVQSFTSIESQSDSDEDRLVIDDGFDKSIEMSSASVSKATTSTPVQTPQLLSKNKSRKISSDVDPLGQILKMQTQLLKPGAKTERTSTENSGKNEQLPQSPEKCQASVVSVSDSTRATLRKDTSDCSKVLLSDGLLALEEDEEEYTVEPNENLVYKLFSLDNILLLLQSSVHTALTGRKRSSVKMTKKQTPVFVLTKMDYQYCYGVESLTESESCRLWTESLVNSNCTLYVGDEVQDLLYS